MNLTHTVGDIRSFINACVFFLFLGVQFGVDASISSRPENLSRPYVIMLTFPKRTLDDDSATIQGAGLVNSVVVQSWV